MLSWCKESKAGDPFGAPRVAFLGKSVRELHLPSSPGLSWQKSIKDCHVCPCGLSETLHLLQDFLSLSVAWFGVGGLRGLGPSALQKGQREWERRSKRGALPCFFIEKSTLCTL